MILQGVVIPHGKLMDLLGEVSEERSFLRFCQLFFCCQVYVLFNVLFIEVEFSLFTLTHIRRCVLSMASRCRHMCRGQVTLNFCARGIVLRFEIFRRGVGGLTRKEKVKRIFMHGSFRREVK